MVLHRALIAKGLTTLWLHHDFRDGSTRLLLGREYDDATDFSRYAMRFAVDQVPCTEPQLLCDGEARDLLRRADAGEALDRIETLVRAGRHEMVVLRIHARLGIRTANHVHSSVLGHDNGYHAIRAGGIRRHEPAEPELDVLVDGLNLGRGMSFKNAAAGIPFGGCKMTVQCAPVSLGDSHDELERLGFLAFCIDAGNFMTGPDMGFPTALADALQRRFTKNIMGGPAGPMGPTGTPTARGCFTAMREIAEVLWGSRDLRGRRVAVQGLGAVGLPLARSLREAGTHLIVADPDPDRVRMAREELGEIEVVAPERILEAACDILAPCALGGVLHEESIARLRCAALCGSANNQLRAVSQEEELSLAKRVSARGIVYPPEWTHNIAGVVAGFEEYVRRAEASMERVDRHMERTISTTIREQLREARATGRTETAVAYAKVERLIYRES